MGIVECLAAGKQCGAGGYDTDVAMQSRPVVTVICCLT